MNPESESTWRGRTCVVTGGTRGLGLWTAERLARSGADVAVCSRNHDDAVEAARLLSERFGVRTLGRGVDIAQPDEVDRFAIEVNATLGVPSLIVANAAVLGPVGPLVQVDMDDWIGALAIDLIGTVATAGSFARTMVPAGQGKIVVLAGGGVGGPGVAPRISAYTTSKAAIVTFVETFAAEVEPHGIQINAIAPGAFPTGFTSSIVTAGAEVAGDDLYRATRQNAERSGDFDRYADLLLYVASPMSNWLTGRFLSARWETPESLERDRASIETSDRFRMRRIDADLYDERAR